MLKRLLICLMMFGAAQAHGQTRQPAYSDNRSSPADLIQSLYNAINRQEYLRAYSYFRDGSLGLFSSYAAGFADTDHVAVKLGQITSDAGAGTAHHAVPVAIQATDTKGRVTVFVGCYLLTQVQPAVQATPPFQPIIIDEGHLTRTDQTFAKAMGKCD